jgi:hypothetical protein
MPGPATPNAPGRINSRSGTSTSLIRQDRRNKLTPQSHPHLRKLGERATTAWRNWRLPPRRLETPFMPKQADAPGGRNVSRYSQSS